MQKCIISALGDVPGVVGAAQALTDVMAPAPRSPRCLCKPHAEELRRWDPSGALRGWEGTGGCSAQLCRLLALDFQPGFWASPELSC